MNQWWDYPDVAQLMALSRAQHEDATMTGNVGAYMVPIGGTLRAQAPDKINCTGSKECSVDYNTWRRLYGR